MDALLLQATPLLLLLLLRLLQLPGAVLLLQLCSWRLR
jgi:hypothetical protein